MDSEESQSIFTLFFDYLCIYDHILMLANTYKVPERHTLAEVMKGNNSRHNGHLLGFTRESELIHTKKAQASLETIKSRQTSLVCTPLK